MGWNRQQRISPFSVLDFIAEKIVGNIEYLFIGKIAKK
jgi:hypothetical protein